MDEVVGVQDLFSRSLSPDFCEMEMPRERAKETRREM